MNARTFVQELAKGNEAMFRASELQVKSYFDSKPSKDELVDHFTGRMVNERMNLIEISAQIAAAPADADVVELNLLSKQAQDEARHFRMVKDVIEHISGEPCDVVAAVEEHSTKLDSKGAALIKKYGADKDPLMLALYQFVAEGRAARNWAMMSECIEDDFVARTYAKIAKDEKFHSKIGERKLLQLCSEEEAQERIMEVADAMRKDLFLITCAKSGMNVESKQIMEDAYGTLH
jgi:1,2-phenylacetyl-CoA epoxidase catalytic subunit